MGGEGGGWEMSVAMFAFGNAMIVKVREKFSYVCIIMKVVTRHLIYIELIERCAWYFYFSNYISL